MKLEKGIPLIDQHDENGYWGGKFGGNQIAESLNYPIEELTREFEKLRNDETFIAERDYYFKNFVGAPTPFFSLTPANQSSSPRTASAGSTSCRRSVSPATRNSPKRS